LLTTYLNDKKKGNIPFGLYFAASKLFHKHTLGESADKFLLFSRFLEEIH